VGGAQTTATSTRTKIARLVIFCESLHDVLGTLFLPPLALDRSSPIPLYEQLHKQLGEAIIRGAVVGARLPSTRLLARILGRDSIALDIVRR
jgi:hypothetical protein